MKNNNEKISILENYYKILQIKKTKVIQEISILKNKVSIVNKTINNIEFCLKDYYKNTLRKRQIPKRESDDITNKSNQYIVILFDNNNTTLFEYLRENYKKEDSIIIISKYSHTSIDFAKKINGIQITPDEIITTESNFAYGTLSFSKLIYNIQRRSIEEYDSQKIILLSQSIASNLSIQQIYPMEFKLDDSINCHQFLQAKNISFLPTKTIWRNEIINSSSILKIRSSLINYDIIYLLRESLKIKENMEILENKISDLIKQDKINKNIRISDELNIFQG